MIIETVDKGLDKFLLIETPMMTTKKNKELKLS